MALKEYDLGSQTFTRRQLNLIGETPIPNAEGVTYRKGKLFVRADDSLTPDQVQAIKDAILAVPDEPTDFQNDKARFKNNAFFNKNIGQINNWIDNNVNDLASAKLVLKEMAEVIWFYIKRSGLKR